ncbi:MAG: GldG family protein [Gammaproteobacteria bacterium]|nr:GldG family protein [Gammaproteobacteria bacterium]
MKTSKTIRLQLQIQKIIFIILLLCVVGLLAWASQKYSVQYDWTAGQRNTISQSSIDLLATMQDPVTVNVYIQDDPTLKTAIEEILNRYKREKNNFNFKLINPDINIELAQLDKVTRYGQIVIKYQGRSEIVSSLSEATLSSALQRLSFSGNRSAVFIEGHGERAPSGQENTDYSQFTNQLTAKGIISSSHNLLKAPLADNTDVLVIASPEKPLLKGEIEHIRKHIENGGNLLWMMDPGTSSEQLNGLSELAQLLNIKFVDGIVVDNNTNLRKTLGIQHPAMIPVLDYYPHAITKNLSYNTLFPVSRGITIEDNDEWKSTVIAQSLPQSWSETKSLINELVFDSNSGDLAGPMPIVIALERTLNENKEKSDKASQRIIVAGDSDFLSNSYIGVGANLNLGLGIIDWLNGDDDLISIDIKNAPDTKLQLDDTELLIISFGFFILLPAGLLFIGIFIWFSRRKR